MKPSTQKTFPENTGRINDNMSVEIMKFLTERHTVFKYKRGISDEQRESQIIVVKLLLIPHHPPKQERMIKGIRKKCQVYRLDTLNITLNININH